MSLKNYYTSYYYSIVNKDISKATIFFLLNEEEQKVYSDEYGNFDYSEIFGSNNADDYIEEILKKDEYKEFHKQLLSEVKKIAANYFLSTYKAVMDEDHNKIIKLLKLSFNEIASYPNEFLEINYDKVFQDNDPNEVIGNLFTNKLLSNADFYKNILYNDSQIYLIMKDKSNPLANINTVEKREESEKEVLKSPVLNYCPNPDIGLNIIDSLLSVTYSKVFNYNQVSSLLFSLINKSNIFVDLFSVMSLSSPLVSKSSNSQISIMLTEGEISNFDPTMPSSHGGYSNPVTNILLVNTDEDKNQINAPFFAHEFYHRFMNLLYNSIHSNPYSDQESIKIDEYHSAIKNVLLNIHDFIKQKFDFDLKIDKNADTWEIGKTLALLLFPENIGDDLLFNRYISLLLSHDLTLGSKFSWFDYGSSLGRFLACKRFDLADKLIELGVRIPSYGLNKILAIKDKDLIEWGFKNQKDIDLNFKDDEGKTALDYFNNDEVMTKRLIEAGAKVYPANYDEICSVDPEHQEDKNLSPEMINYLSAIKWFLVLYIQSNTYSRESEDAEFIVRLPQIIAEDLYYEEVKETLKPLEQFIAENITPDCIEYIYQNDKAGICLPLNEYSS